MHRSWALLDRLPRRGTYVLAIAFTLAALALRLAIGARPMPLVIVFLLPVLASGFVGGLGPGILATALGALASAYFVLEPRGSLAVHSPEDIARLIWLVSSGAAISLVCGAFHRARGEAEASRREATSALERLGEQRERLSAVFHDSPVSMALVRLADGRIVEFNEAFLDLHGFTREEIASGAVREPALFALPAEQERVHAMLQETGHVHGEPIRFRRGNGETGEGVLSLRTLQLGGVPHAIGLLSDLTQARRLARDMRESEARQSALYRSSPLAIMLTRLRDGVLIDCNEAALRFGGVERSSILGKTGIEMGVWTAEERAVMVERLQREGAIRHHEMRYTRADGAKLDVLYFAEPIEIQGERCLMSTFVDITERKRLERTVHDYQLHLEQLVAERTQALSDAMGALARSEERYRTLFARARTPMLLVDPETEEIVDANEAALAFYGHDPQGLRAMRFSQLGTLPGEAQLAQGAIAAAEGRSHLYSRHRLAGGEERDVEIHCGLVQIEARALLFCLVHDITDRRHFERALRESEAQHRAVMESAEETILVAGEEGRVQYGNPAALRALGYSQEQLAGMRMQDILSPEEHEHLSAHFEALERGEHAFGSWVLRRRDGSSLTFEFNTLRLPDGRRLAIGRDISGRRASEQRLALAASVFREAAEAIFITDPQTTIVDVNTAFTQVTGYGREEAVGRTPRLLHSGHQDTAFYERMWKAIGETGHWHGEIWNRRKDGAMFACRTTITAVKDAEGGLTHYIGLFSDITERRLEMEAIEHQAHFDALTQLPNRLLLEDRMKQAFARARRQAGRVAVCFLDLDRFKPVNDEHGHMAGDHLLVAIARRLQSCVRVNDTVARVGGDEFVLLLADLGPGEEWREVLERVLRAVAEPCPLPPGKRAHVTASAGVTLFPADDGSPGQLLRHADEAMYLAKRRMPGTYVIYASVESRSAV